MTPQEETTDEQGRVEREVRASLAFEHMLAAAVTGGAASAVGALALSFGRLLVEASASLTTVLQSLLQSLATGVVVFLLAFATSIAVFTPLYTVLEKNRVRKIWPFYLAAFAVQFGLLAMAGQAPGFEAPWRVVFLLPGFLIVFLFARRIVPLWQAADRAGAAQPVPLRLVR